MVVYLTLPDTGEARIVAAMVQASVTALAITVAGVFAGRKLQVFRDFEPHLTISHDISHRRVGDSYVHIFVTATLRNSSKVAVEIREELFRIQQIAPTADGKVERLVAEVFEDGERRHMQWPTLEEVEGVWRPNEVIVEPSESHQEVVEFIVPAEARSVLVYTYFYNSKFSRGSRASRGWDATSVYDIVDLSLLIG